MKWYVICQIKKPELPWEDFSLHKMYRDHIWKWHNHHSSLIMFIHPSTTIHSLIHPSSLIMSIHIKKTSNKIISYFRIEGNKKKNNKNTHLFQFFYLSLRLFTMENNAPPSQKTVVTGLKGIVKSPQILAIINEVVPVLSSIHFHSMGMLNLYATFYAATTDQVRALQVFIHVIYLFLLFIYIIHVIYLFIYLFIYFIKWVGNQEYRARGEVFNQTLVDQAMALVRNGPNYTRSQAPRLLRAAAEHYFSGPLLNYHLTIPRTGSYIFLIALIYFIYFIYLFN